MMLIMAFNGLLSAAGPPDEPIPVAEMGEKPDFDLMSERNVLESQGWQRYSIKLFGHWVSYSNWGPLGYLLAAAATIAESHKYGLPQDKRTATDTMGKLQELVMHGNRDTLKTASRRFFGVADEMGYLSNFVDLWKIIQASGDLVMNAPGEDNASDKLKQTRRDSAEIGNYASRIVTSFIPVAQLANTIAQSQDRRNRATEFGSIRGAIANRVPELGPHPGPSTNLIPSLATDPEFGSNTGRRQGLAERVNSLGQPSANPYAGIYSWLPWRATAEDLSSPTLNALREARVGVPTPPQELWFTPETGDRKGKLTVVTINPRMRQAIAADAGEKIDARVKKALSEVTPEQRAADPDAWSKRLADEVKGAYDDAKKPYTSKKTDERNTSLQSNLMEPLAADPNRRREPPPMKPKETAVPDLGPPVLDENGTPVPASPTPAVGPTQRVGDLRATQTAAGEPTATPRPRNSPTPGGATPIPAPAAATSTPRPAAATATPRPGGKTQVEIDREKQRQRALGTPTPTR
jgi:hypothetical protein